MKRVSIKVVEGADKGMVYSIPDGGVIVGRSRTAEVQLQDGALSRQHCRFYYLNGFPMVEDLGSSNGTMVDGVSIVGPVPLALKDKVSLGETVLEIIEDVPFNLNAPPPSATPQFSFSVTPPAQPEEPKSEPVAPPAPSEEAPKPKVETIHPDVPEAMFALAPEAGDSLEQSPAETPEKVDLGLQEEAATAPHKARAHGLLFGVVAVCVLVLGAMGAYMLAQEPPPPPVVPKALDPWEKMPFAFHYERLEMSETTLYRYTADYTNDRTLNIAIVDVVSNREILRPNVTLTPEDHDALRKLLYESNYASMGAVAPAVSLDETVYHKKALTILFGKNVWEMEVENTPYPRFDKLCASLESFLGQVADLGVTIFSQAELLARARESLDLAERYWEERDLADGRLFECVRYYKEGLIYAEPLNPKPAFYESIVRGLARAEETFEKRYEDLTFAIQKAEGTRNSAELEQCLQAVLRMIPDPEDARYRSASDKLLNLGLRTQNRGR